MKELLKSVVYTGIGAAFLTSDDNTDQNGDGVVNFLDMEKLQSLFLAPPGPSDVATLCN